MKKKDKTGKAKARAAKLASIHEVATDLADPELCEAKEAEAEATTLAPAVFALADVGVNITDLHTVRAPVEAPESTIGGETTCIVCFTNPKSHIATACGHQCVCGPCSSKLDLCPYCREPVMKWVHVRVV